MWRSFFCASPFANCFVREFNPFRLDKDSCLHHGHENS